MNIKEMHYDFKMKFNKIDSQQFRNLKIPEIDWLLNEAVSLFVKNIAFPRKPSYTKFEQTQRTIDDIKALVKTQSLTIVSNNPIIYSLPEDYQFYVDGYVYMSKDCCIPDNAKGIKYVGDLIIRKHYTTFDKSPFDNSSFEWRVVNGIFNEKGLQLYTDGTFEITGVDIVYIKKHPYMHNAEDFGNSGYKRPGTGIILTGTQNCILDEHTHNEIVDLAVMLAQSSIQDLNVQGTMNKIGNFDEIK